MDSIAQLLGWYSTPRGNYGGSVGGVYGFVDGEQVCGRPLDAPIVDNDGPDEPQDPNWKPRVSGYAGDSGEDQ